ncbi:POK8 protein, partial [Donacobius atricapilla]|nr:POK8 protein [Donacobius atricapilla]
AGFQVAEDKIQQSPPWKYLGYRLTEHMVTSQALQLQEDPATLHDIQKLIVSITWIWTLLGITNQDLAPLFDLLKADMNLNSPRELTQEAKTALNKISTALQTRQAHRCDLDLPFSLAVMGENPHFYGLIVRSFINFRMLFFFLSYQMPKTKTANPEILSQLVIRARSQILSLSGKDFSVMFIPLTPLYLEWLIQQSEVFQIALSGFSGQISVHFPKHKLLCLSFTLIQKPLRNHIPLNALPIFTYGSGKPHKSVITWKNPNSGNWEADIELVEGSPQIVELAAVVCVFSKFPIPFNLVTDSFYV